MHPEKLLIRLITCANLNYSATEPHSFLGKYSLQFPSYALGLRVDVFQSMQYDLLMILIQIALFYHLIKDSNAGNVADLEVYPFLDQLSSFTVALQTSS